MTLIDENMAEQAILDWFEVLGVERDTHLLRLKSSKLHIPVADDALEMAQ